MAHYRFGLDAVITPGRMLTAKETLDSTIVTGSILRGPGLYPIKQPSLPDPRPED